MYTHALPSYVPFPCREGDIESLSPPSFFGLPPEYRLFTLNFARLRRSRSDYDMRYSPYPETQREAAQFMAGAPRSQKSRDGPGQRPSLFIPHGLSPSCLEEGEEERGTLLDGPTIILASQPTQPLWSSSLAWGQTTTFPPQKLLCHPPTSPCKNCILRGQVRVWRRRVG